MKKVFLAIRRHLVEQRETWLLAVLASACCAATVWLFAPGYMSLDSVLQLEQARSLVLTDHHPVSMALLWHCLDNIADGPLGMLVLSNVLSWFGLAAFFRSRRWPLLLRALGLPLLGFYPPVFCIAGAIWKDALMQGALLAALGCLLSYARWQRGWVLGAGLLLAAVALTMRHNALAAVCPILVLPLFGLRALQRFRVGLRAVLAALLSLVGSVTALVVLLGLLSRFASPAHFWQMIATFDLAGISVRSGQLAVEPGNKALSPGVGLREIRHNYRASNHMSLYQCTPRRTQPPCVPTFRRVSEKEDLDVLAANWERAVRAHPRAYLAHRYAVYELVAGLTKRPAKLLFLDPGGLAHRYPLPARAKRTLSWFGSLTRTLYFSVWIYVALAFASLLASVGFLWKTGSILPMALSLSSIGYSLSLFFGTGAQDYRYSVWTVLSALLALLALAEPWRPSSRPATPVNALPTQIS